MDNGRRDPIVLAAVLTLGITLAAAGPAAAQQPVEATFLHVLMVVDTTDPSIGKSVDVDRQTMDFVLRTGVPAGRYRTTTLSGRDASPENILKYYRTLPMRDTDSLLFYYAGHGAWDTKSHYLVMNGGQRIRRTEIREAMERRGGPLNILLTDCCSTYTGQAAFAKQIVADPYLYRDLLFRHRGTVDVTAARKGQLAIGNKLKGGYFTVGLSDLFLYTETVQIDVNRDGIVSWTEASEVLRRQTQAAFEMMRPRGLKLPGNPTRQTPHVFGQLARSAGQPIPPCGHRLGVRLAAAPGGLRVTEVFPGSPAAWAGIRVGEVLVNLGYVDPEFRFRQVPVQSPTQFSRAVAGLPLGEVATVYLQDPRTQQRRDLRLRLGR